jgi:hypothetical protein
VGVIADVAHENLLCPICKMFDPARVGDLFQKSGGLGISRRRRVLRRVLTWAGQTAAYQQLRMRYTMEILATLRRNCWPSMFNQN